MFPCPGQSPREREHDAETSETPGISQQISFRCQLHQLHLLVQDDAAQRFEIADPWRATQHRLGMRIAGVPALHDAAWTEVDVLGVVLSVQLRRKQAHHMHACLTAVAEQLSNGWVVALALGQSRSEL